MGGPQRNPHWLHPPQRRGMICLSFKDKMVSLPVFPFLYLFIFGYAGSSLLHRLFSSCGKWGLLFVEVCGLLLAVASLVAEHGLQSTGSIVVAHGLSSSVTCGIFFHQGSNLRLLHWQVYSLPLSHQGDPYQYF